VRTRIQSQLSIGLSFVLVEWSPCTYRRQGERTSPQMHCSNPIQYYSIATDGNERESMSNHLTDVQCLRCYAVNFLLLGPLLSFSCPRLQTVVFLRTERNAAPSRFIALV